MGPQFIFHFLPKEKSNLWLLGWQLSGSPDSWVTLLTVVWLSQQFSGSPDSWVALPTVEWLSCVALLTVKWLPWQLCGSPDSCVALPTVEQLSQHYSFPFLAAYQAGYANERDLICVLKNMQNVTGQLIPIPKCSRNSSNNVGNHWENFVQLQGEHWVHLGYRSTSE